MKQSSFIVETPERVRLSYEIAESATRAAAFLVDAALQVLVALMVVLSILGSFTLLGNSALYSAFALVVVFAVQWGYGVFFETLLAGRTPGKLLFKLRVLRLDGESLDMRSIVMRNLLRAADGLPLMILPLLGGFVAVADPWSRRIGDIVAGTVVIRDTRSSLAFPAVAFAPAVRAEAGTTMPGGARLDERELYVLRRFLAERGSLPAGRAESVATVLAEKTALRLGIVASAGAGSVAFLEATYLAHWPTRSSAFAAGRQGRWEELARLLGRCRSRGPRRLGESAPRFAELYREACGDLAEARAASLSPDLEEYLNALVGEARAVVYSVPLLPRGAVGAFFLRDMPAAARRVLPFIAAAAGLFLASFAPSFALSARGDGSAAYGIVAASTLEGMLASHTSNDFSQVGIGERSAAASFYIANNVTIDFLCIATGAFFGIGPLFLIVENGLSLGAIAGFVVARGGGAGLGRFVLAHTPLELAGLVLSGACGLLLGWTMLRAGRLSRAEALNRRMDDFLPLLAAAAICTTLAAFVEGFVSPSPASLVARAAIAATSVVLLAAYFAILPRAARKRS